MFVQKAHTTTIILDEDESAAMQRILNVQLDQGDFRDDYLAGEILRELRGEITDKVGEETPDNLRWFSDRDGDLWRENSDSTVTMMVVMDDGRCTSSETFHRLDRGPAEAHYGPFRECEKPQS